VTVEFFLVLPMVLLVVLASVQVISLARARLELQGAVRDGARIAATTPDPSRAVESVLAAVDPSERERLRVSVERPARVGANATVTATMRHLLGPPFPATFGVDVSARATMRVER
jgi:Flp pilus assembly protein TadG